MTEHPSVDFDEINIDVPWGFVTGRWYGNRNVRPILAIHGWLDNLGTWDRLIPLLPQHIGVLCIDLPGHGRSSKYPSGVSYHTIDNVHVIKRVINKYNWSMVSLMGHSMGGICCSIYAALYSNTVDMLIQVDIIASPRKTANTILKMMAIRAEKLIIENERMGQLSPPEPPSYTYQQLEELMHSGSKKSVEKRNSKYLLNRGIVQSQQYPKKYFFSRDGKLKYNTEFVGENGLYLEMAKRISNLNHLVIRATQSTYINDEMNNLIEYFEKNNHNFEIHAIVGTHHAHLNNPLEVANVLKPFILRHRPVSSILSSISDNPGDRVREKKSKL